MTFGQKSEKTEYITDGQLSLFNEAVQEENRKERAREKETVVPEHKRKAKRTHEEMLKELQVEEVVHENEESCDKQCISVRNAARATQKTILNSNEL